VIGGGPAGTSTAIALVRAGASVLIVERGICGRDKFGESLPPSVRPLLQRLGVWDTFLGTGARPSYANRSSWGGDGQVVDQDFIRDPHGIGWHIDRVRFEAMLREQAVAAGAYLLNGARIDAAERQHDRQWRLLLTGAHGAYTATAPVVVDAGGRAATFARRQGARRRRLDRLIASTLFLSPYGASPCEGLTLVEAVRDGWWYSAPLPDSRLAVAFFTDPDLAAARDAKTLDGLMCLLSESGPTRERVETHGGQSSDPPRIVAVGSSVLDQIVGDGWLAVGDAAATFDPLSSHGIGAALDGGLRSAAAVQAYLTGDGDALSGYAGQVLESFVHYLWMWRAYYAEECRWPGAPFWRRRHSMAQSRAFGSATM
jgi:flavin-dependent dehydrogenase